MTRLAFTVVWDDIDLSEEEEMAVEQIRTLTHDFAVHVEKFLPDAVVSLNKIGGE